MPPSLPPSLPLKTLSLLSPQPQEAVLTKAYAVDAIFEGADLTNAVVDRVAFDGANMRNTNWTNAVVTGGWRLLCCIRRPCCCLGSSGRGSGVFVCGVRGKGLAGGAGGGGNLAGVRTALTGSHPPPPRPHMHHPICMPDMHTPTCTPQCRVNL